MTMHHIDVSPRFVVPADEPSSAAASVTRMSVADPSVCEWAVDLNEHAGSAIDARSGPAAVSFVDFDAIETIHVSKAAAQRT